MQNHHPISRNHNSFKYDENKIDFFISEEIRSKKDTSILMLHFYNFWIKDENEILKNSFSDGQLPYNFLIIHPNGDFHASHYFMPFSDHKKLLNYKSFKKEEKKWLKLIEKIN